MSIHDKCLNIVPPTYDPARSLCNTINMTQRTQSTTESLVSSSDSSSTINSKKQIKLTESDRINIKNI
jgi:hypothetical protein